MFFIKLYNLCYTKQTFLRVFQFFYGNNLLLVCVAILGVCHVETMILILVIDHEVCLQFLRLRYHLYLVASVINREEVRHAMRPAVDLLMAMDGHHQFAVEGTEEHLALAYGTAEIILQTNLLDDAVPVLEPLTAIYHVRHTLRILLLWVFIHPASKTIWPARVE